MKVINTSLEDCVLLQPDIFHDSRGCFYETFRLNEFLSATGFSGTFVQENHSYSSKGVFRGLHFQQNNPQGKLVRVSRGTVLDIAVDLRPESNTFGQSEVFEISDENCLQVWVPPGFAHGFLSLTEQVEIIYKVTNYWHKSFERSLRWDDPSINIQWPNMSRDFIISDKDRKAKTISDINNFNFF